MTSVIKLFMLAGIVALCSQFARAADAAATPPLSGSAPQQPPGPTAPPTTSALAGASDPAYTYKTLRLNRAAFDALAAKPEQLVVLDIRRPDELEKYGGFPVYLSIQTADVQKSLAYIPQNRLIVTVSNHAHRAGAVGDILTSLGYQFVGAIGVLDYEAEGGTLTKVAPPPPKTAPTSSASPPTNVSSTLPATTK
jgi:rhodanese-related sulfurtransferase